MQDKSLAQSCLPKVTVVRIYHKWLIIIIKILWYTELVGHIFL